MIQLFFNFMLQTYTMKNLLPLALLACMLQNTLAQNIIVEKVKISTPANTESVANIPRLKDTANPGNEQVAAINASLLEWAELSDYTTPTDELRYAVDFESEVKSDIVYIHITGEYYAAYPSPVDVELFYSLKTGEAIGNRDLSFQSLFTLNGYLDFLNKFWLTPQLKTAFQKANVCAGIQPSCSYYDISEYVVSENKLKISLDKDCYPHAMQACSPSYSISVPMDSVKHYLAPYAKQALLDDQYQKLKGVAKLQYNQRVRPNIPYTMYLFGLIDNKYPISMALTVDLSSNTVKGYYYYDKKRQPLALKGTFANNILDMTETVNNQQTGKFYFTFTNAYNGEAFPLYDPTEMLYLNGTWLSMDGAKKYKIKFTEVKRTRD
jgi:hypothetical protein